MSSWVRILLVIACIAALYYLVVALARGVQRDEIERLETGSGVELVPGRGPDGQ